jgi:hypothetical protein
MKLTNKSSGQAMIEYLLLLVFLLILSSRMISGFSSFMSDSIGNLAHVLSLNLSTGICENECYFKGYLNEYKE